MKLSVVQFGRLDKYGKKPIFLKLYHNFKSDYIKTGISVEPKYFKNGRVITPVIEDNLRLNSIILEVSAKYSKAASVLSDTSTFQPVGTIKKMLLAMAENPNLEYIEKSDFMGVGYKIIEDLKLEERSSHAATINSTMSVMKIFCDQRNIDAVSFEQITPEFLKQFHRWYVPKRGKEVSFNKHLRNIRLIFNDARRNRVISRDIYPFEYYSIPTNYRAEIRCLEPEIIERISREQGLGRDIFMLSFYLCGMNFADIVSIPYSTEYIEVERKKTIRSVSSNMLRLKLQPEVFEIVGRYADEDKKMLLKLPVQSEYALYRCDRELRAIGKKLGLSRLSSVFARHSWATIAGELDVNDKTIDRALMHTPSGMIEKYRKFNYSKVDEANRKVIDRVFVSAHQ